VIGVPMKWVPGKMALLAVGMAFAAIHTGHAERAPGFAVSATLRNGRTIEGKILAESLAFDAFSPSGQRVRVAVEKPPSWAAGVPACEIEWSAERKLYVIRAVAWTGELLRLWERLAVTENNGAAVTVAGTEVRSIRFLFVDAATAKSR